MVELDKFRAEIKGLTKEQLTDIQRAIRLEKMAKYTKKGLKLHGYLSESEKQHIPLVLDWLKDAGWIENKTIYNLTTVAVKVLIQTVHENIRKSGQKPRTP